jgi:hypothetical protein
MKRAVGILLVVLAFAFATAGLCGAIGLLLAVLRPEFGRLLEPTFRWIAQEAGIDRASLPYVPTALAFVSLCLGAVGQQLLGRVRMLQFTQSDVLDRTAA